MASRSKPVSLAIGDRAELKLHEDSSRQMEILDGKKVIIKDVHTDDEGWISYTVLEVATNIEVFDVEIEELHFIGRATTKTLEQLRAYIDFQNME